MIGEGDGERTAFELVKTYGSAHAPYAPAIAKPVAGSVTIAVDGETLADGWSVDTTSGVVTFDTAPAADAVITAGFRFDVPVRFDTDRLDVNLTSFAAGDIPAIPLVIIRPFLPESPKWAMKKAAGTLKRPSIAELFNPQLRKTTIITTPKTAWWM